MQGRKTRVPSASRPIREPNKWEAKYHREILLPLIARGAIISAEFEAIKLRYGAGTYYTPDWVVWTAGGRLEAHEVKGHWHPGAKSRYQAARDRHRSIRFFAKTLKDGMWVDA